MAKFEVWKLPRKKKAPGEHENYGSSSNWCMGECNMTHIQCLKKRNVNMKENREEMKKQVARNLDGLFVRENTARISVKARTWQTGLFIDYGVDNGPHQE